MRSSFLPFLALLLYNFYCGNSLSIHSDENIEDQSSNGNTKLIDLNEDCLYIIFNRLDFLDLLNVAQINSKFARIASDLYRQKYSDYELQINKPKSGRYDAPYEISTLRTRHITINELDLTSNIMKYFGNHVRKVNIVNQSTCNYTVGSDWATINQIVNEYGSESLTDLTIGYATKELWPLWRLPFKNVENLIFTITTDIDGMKLNQLYPKLKKLQIQVMNEANYDFIDCKLPHLQHLDVALVDEEIWNRKEQIIGLIEKNPQIRRINAKYALPEFVEVISEHCHDLEYVSLTFNDQQNEPLHFDHVKHCDLFTWADHTLRNLSFSHLESLEITYFIGEFDKYTDFFQRHSNISRLYLTGVWDSTLDLQELTTELPNLVEMIVAFYSGINTENVTSFIGGHPQLMKLRILGGIPEADRKILCERFEQNWHIVDENDAILFERKIQF